MMIHCQSGRDFLRRELARRIESNPRYSLRAFARHLGMSPGELSEILNGKRLLSMRSVRRISQALGLSPPETQHLLAIAQHDGDRAPALPVRVQPLDEDGFRLVSDWYCFAILSLADCAGFRDDSRWIAGRLGISRTEAELALERLLRLNLLRRKGRKLIAADSRVESPDAIPSEAVRSYHRQMLDKARRAIDTQSIDSRELGGAGFALDPEDLPRLKREVSEFCREIAVRYSRGRKKTEVYQLELALFRLTEPT